MKNLTMRVPTRISTSITVQ